VSASAEETLRGRGLAVVGGVSFGAFGARGFVCAGRSRGGRVGSTWCIEGGWVPGASMTRTDGGRRTGLYRCLVESLLSRCLRL
jgi:hypothetical protein